MSWYLSIGLAIEIQEILNFKVLLFRWIRDVLFVLFIQKELDYTIAFNSPGRLGVRSTHHFVEF